MITTDLWASTIWSWRCGPTARIPVLKRAMRSARCCRVPMESGSAERASLDADAGTIDSRCLHTHCKSQGDVGEGAPQPPTPHPLDPRIAVSQLGEKEQRSWQSTSNVKSHVRHQHPNPSTLSCSCCLVLYQKWRLNPIAGISASERYGLRIGTH